MPRLWMLLLVMVTAPGPRHQGLAQRFVDPNRGRGEDERIPPTTTPVPILQQINEYVLHKHSYLTLPTYPTLYLSLTDPILTTYPGLPTYLTPARN